MMEKHPTGLEAERRLDTALGHAVACARKAAGMNRERAVAKLPITAGHLLAYERGGASLTLSRLAALSEQMGADPLDLVREALLAAPDHHPAPGTTTRLVHTIHQMHPERREHLAEMIAVLGVKARS